MYLKKRRVKGIYYFAIVESYREEGKVKQRIIENLGNAEKAFITIRDKEEYKEYIDEVAKYVNTQSPLIWFGGKCRIAKKLIELMPKHRTYVEPFGGAAHVLIQKKPSPVEVYNDINSDVVNFLMVVREDANLFYNAIATLPYSRELYESWKKTPAPNDYFERAVRWFYINRSGISGSHKGRTGGWRHGINHNTVGTYRSSCELIKPLCNRLLKVNIESKDFRDIIQKYDSPNTFFYVDPPYVGREYRYDGDFSQQDHIELAELLNNIKGKAMLSYYDNTLLNLYSKWCRVEFDSYRYSEFVKEGECKSKTKEIVLMNYT